MGLQLTEIRINNFRSIEELNLKLNDLNLLIGQNNCGKSNLLRAICIAINNQSVVSSQDIHLKKGEELTKEKKAIIDIKIQPTGFEGNIIKNFSEFWVGVFTDRWIVNDETEGDYVGIRSTIEYDVQFDQYIVTKKPIKQWKESISESIPNMKRAYTTEMQSYMLCFYMDAHRDIIEDIRNKKSYFGRATSSKDIPETVVREIEAKLSEVNDLIVEKTPTLKGTQTMMAQIGEIVGTPDSQLLIEPISRKITDLHRGIDVKYEDGQSASFSISEHGMGTRSWISFLTLDAYIRNLTSSLKADDEDVEIFVVLALEEPEAHLHSYAQKKLFGQIKKFCGHKIVSTHSSSIVTQASVCDLIHLYKKSGKTEAHRIKTNDYTKEEIAKIHREVIRSNGELLFSTGIVLAEGITEEQALPVFFEKYFGFDPNYYGMAFLGIRGQNYKTYLKLVRDFRIPWFIFGDGETSAISTIKSALKVAFENDDIPDNVIIIDNGDDYENHLIRNSYGDYIIDAINSYELQLLQDAEPEIAARDTKTYFEKFIDRKNHSVEKSQKTGRQCELCHQDIVEKVLRCYDGEEGRKKAILDCCQQSDAKAKYSYLIAVEIVTKAEEGKKIPPKVKDLMNGINEVFHWR